MQITPQKALRSQSFECFRLLSAFLVVCAHCPPPNPLGIATDAIVRFAVPFFFAVSGYFSFRTTEAQLKKRLVSILSLILSATLLYVIFEGFAAHFIRRESLLQWFRDTLPPRHLFSWLLRNTNPISGHLWYLNAIFCCYGALFLYTKWCDGTPDYRPVYWLAVPLFLALLLMDSLLPSVQIIPNNTLYRNAVFFGFPMMALGLFLREHHEKLQRVFHLTPARLYLLALAGLFLAMLQRYGVERCEVPVGILLTVTAAMLLCIRTPQITDKPVLCFLISKIGKWSTYIYINHILVLNLYLSYGCYFACSIFGQTVEAYLRPILVFLLSLLLGILWDLIRSLFSRRKNP